MGKKRKRGKSVRRQKAAAAAAAEEETEASKVPKSFVVQRGVVGRHVKRLIKDLRRVQEPHTATALKPRQANSLRDFTSVAGPLGVSHMLVLTRSDLPALHLRLIRLPQGPTITFRVEEYVLAKDVVSAQKRASVEERSFQHGPLVILNNFRSSEKAEKLTQIALQNLYPSINVNKANLNEVKRAVLWNHEPESGLIHFRHYAIKAVPAGVSRSTKKLVTKKKIPDLSKYEDVADFFNNPGQLSESEGEDLGDGSNEVSLAQALAARGLKAPNSSAALRLAELGPRLSLRLIKIEAGLDDGEVLFHSFQPLRSPEEVAAQSKAIAAKKKLRLRRRREQEANVERKRRERDAHKQRCQQGLHESAPAETSHTNGHSHEEEEGEEASRGEDGKVKRKRKFGVAFAGKGEGAKPKVVVARKRPPKANKLSKGLKQP